MHLPTPSLPPSAQESASASAVYHGKFGFRDVDSHWQRAVFATAGAGVALWDMERSEPTATYEWGSDSVCAVRFNPAEPDVFASCGSDRSIALYDARSQAPLRKVVLLRRTNRVAWSPTEAFNFVAANEDGALYSFDMRRLESARAVHRDFTGAAMDVDFSPTGREFAAASYDRTVRIFPRDGGHSREVYHTKRMQRVFAVRFSGDGSYVLSGSEDMNVRVWKADAAAPLGTLLPREWKRLQYTQALVERFQHVPEVRRIVRHKHVPRQVLKAGELRRTMEEGARRKRGNVAKHSKPGTPGPKAARKERIVTQLE